MRLIDADELKNELSDKNYITYTHEYGDAIPVEWVMSAIDNAPTVEERPTGHWIKIGELGLGYKCNKCEEVDVIPRNFCGYCGADLRGGRE